MTKVRIAVIGLGAVAQSVHLPLLARLWDKFEIVALADLSLRYGADLAGRYGVPATFTGLEDLLGAHQRGEIELDAVLVATSGTHAPQIEAITAAGLAVFCEKPLALSGAELARLAPWKDKIQLGYMKEYDPATAGLAAALSDEDVRAIDVEILHPSPPRQLAFANLLPQAADIDPEALAEAESEKEKALDFALGQAGEPQLRMLYANVIAGSIIHDISLLRHLGYPIEHIDAVEHWGAGAGELGSISVRARVRGGARLNLSWHYLAQYPAYEETVAFHHSRGTARLRFDVPYLLNAPTRLETVTGTEHVERSETSWPQQEAFENELRAFHALVTTGARPHASVPEAIEDLAVSLAITAKLAESEGWEIGGEARGKIGR